MKTKLLTGMLLASAGMVHLGLTARPAQAHGTHTCTASNCCSPHGATCSKSGTCFWNCGYNASAKQYQRKAACGPGTFCFEDNGCDPYEHVEAYGDSWLQNATNHGLSFNMWCVE